MKVESDIKVLKEFIEVFCANKHPEREKSAPASKGSVDAYLKKYSAELCQECGELFVYAIAMRLICPFDPKPKCAKCVKHCYSPEKRAKIREVMAFSGKYLMKKGRLDILIKYLF